MKTTLNEIRKNSPCESGWRKLLSNLGKTGPDDEPLSILAVLDSNGIDDALWCLRAVEGHDKKIRMYAVWCARQVQHLMTDQRSVAALDVAERFANGEATPVELYAAGSTAWAVAGAARSAAWAAAEAAAWAATGAAGAAGAAEASAEAARSAAWAAAWAAEASAGAAGAAGAAEASAEAAEAAAWAATWAAEAAGAAAEAARSAAQSAAWAAGDAQEQKLREICGGAQ